MQNDIESIWRRIADHTGGVFLLPNGRDFHYEVAGEAVRISCHREPVPKSVIEKALSRMPCDSFEKLPRDCKPRNAVWAILNDTRIYQRDLSQLGRNEFWERRSL